MLGTLVILFQSCQASQTWLIPQQQVFDVCHIHHPFGLLGKRFLILSLSASAYRTPSNGGCKKQPPNFSIEKKSHAQFSAFELNCVLPEPINASRLKRSGGVSSYTFSRRTALFLLAHSCSANASSQTVCSYGLSTTGGPQESFTSARWESYLVAFASPATQSLTRIEPRFPPHLLIFLVQRTDDQLSRKY